MIACKVRFTCKDYRADPPQSSKPRTMTLAASEFIRRFLLHVLPAGFHRLNQRRARAATADTIGVSGVLNEELVHTCRKLWRREDRHAIPVDDPEIDGGKRSVIAILEENNRSS